MADEETTKVPPPWAAKDEAASEAPAPATPEPDAPAQETTIVDKVEKIEAEVVEMVTVTVPKAFKLRIDAFRELVVKAGVQEMERLHAEHWYSVANGVTVYDPKKPG